MQGGWFRFVRAFAGQCFLSVLVVFAFVDCSSTASRLAASLGNRVSGLTVERCNVRVAEFQRHSIDLTKLSEIWFGLQYLLVGSAPLLPKTTFSLMAIALSGPFGDSLVSPNLLQVRLV